MIILNCIQDGGDDWETMIFVCVVQDTLPLTSIYGTVISYFYFCLLLRGSSNVEFEMVRDFFHLLHLRLTFYDNVSYDIGFTLLQPSRETLI